MTFDQKKTEAVKQCHRCGAFLPGSHNFCRSCGISQLGREDLIDRNSGSQVSVAPKALETSQLLSEILVRSLTKSLSIKTAPFRSNRFGTSVVAALTIIPIWLLIILLSPLDAYSAARAASSELNFE
jgi:ribosomal protein L40E